MKHCKHWIYQETTSQIFPEDVSSEFPSLEILNISNSDQFGFNYTYNAMFGLNQTNIKEIYANNINQVGMTYPFPDDISLLLNNTSLRKLHLNYSEIQTFESGSIYYLPRNYRPWKST